MIKKISLSLAGLLLLAVAMVYALMAYQVRQPLTLAETTLLTVKPGAHAGSFSRSLVKKGWLGTRFYLRNYIRLHPSLAGLKAGTYQVTAGMSSLELVKLLVQGKEHQFTVTFIEGSTFKQWLALLAEQPYLQQTLKNRSAREIAALLGLDVENPEGWFFPETYAYTAGTSDLVILQRANKQMRGTLEELWRQRPDGLPYRSPYQALIMASIIEKETRQLAEQPLIASVFINRLRKRMRLQTDPTVIYGLGERYRGDIKRSHLREKTAYNTYRINGLPPTPIAMPGYSSLKAALNPASSDFLYFVSKGDGFHVFSKTLAEHNRAVRRYQLGKG
ncbi:endolytic transglycosylase MltG [Thalassomonas viridans]|uniref:Endolytic murein transglycosylase n=1 Tax=Thalassomonas viridans TaxID=137584 RepID=A0AAE9Z6I7_9GAMM|nr:endolytic transglycosylase MltG [Thalassomonas viridans]WDE07630.1 endolytic transglycosylase MltG [Thalassomonas viridans]